MNFEQLRETFLLRTFGFLKIPLIFYITPRVLELGEERVEIKIPLNWRTKNHLGSMYFGVLCTAADVAGGLIAMKLIQKKGNTVNLVFKDFHAEFLKRPDADTHFICEDGKIVRDLVDRADSSGERVEDTVAIRAVCPSKYGDEVLARFKLTISLKKKSNKS